MKTFTSLSKALLALIFLFSISISGIAQETKKEQKKDSEEIKIKTSAMCNMCKTKIEHDLGMEKGIKSVSLDLDTKIVTVGYDPKKTNPDQIRKDISMIGYDADNVPADKKAFDKLPPCCKKAAEAPATEKK